MALSSVDTHHAGGPVSEEVTTPIPSLPTLPQLPELGDTDDSVVGTSTAVDNHTLEENGLSAPKKVCRSDSANSKGAMEDLFGDVYILSSDPAGTVKPKSKLDIIAEEIRVYKEEQSAPISQNPMLWWSQNAIKYPELSKLARAVLSIPGTSVPSERVFSCAGDIVTATRSCLDPEMVDKLIFLKMNTQKLNK